MKKRMNVVAVLFAAVLGLVGTISCAQASSIIGSPYSGTDLLDLYTDAGPHDQSYSGGISTPGLGTTGDPAGVTYLKYGGDQTTVAMLNGLFTGDKFFMGADIHLNNPASTAMMDANDPGTVGSGKWLSWTAHFTSTMIISHFVIRTADWGTTRTPDQFQLRGSNDGGATWTVIYRYDNNAVAGGSSPWTTVAYDGYGVIPAAGDNSYMNAVAVQFDGNGVDFATPAAYKDIRLEVFSATNGGDGVGITEWQLAGTAYNPPGTTYTFQ